MPKTAKIIIGDTVVKTEKPVRFVLLRAVASGSIPKTKHSKGSVAVILSNAAVSDFDLIQMSNVGITKVGVDTLADHLGITRKRMAEDIFDISAKTLERKTPNQKLDKKLSSHALEIAKVWDHANNIFGDSEKVKSWLNTGNKALNNKKPIEILDTLTGINMVNDILIRIEHGVYS